MIDSLGGGGVVRLDRMPGKKRGKLFGEGGGGGIQGLDSLATFRVSENPHISGVPFVSFLSVSAAGSGRYHRSRDIDLLSLGDL